jgi:hypothetical protein
MARSKKVIGTQNTKEPVKEIVQKEQIKPAQTKEIIAESKTPPVKETVIKPKVESKVSPTKETPVKPVEKKERELSKETLEKVEELKKIAFKEDGFGVEEWIDVDKLHIDQDTQRSLLISQVERIIKDFDPVSFGRISVSKRNDGYFVTDGQHRAYVAKLIGLKKVPCIVSENPNLGEKEVKKFDAVNFLNINQNSQSVKPIDKYRVGVSAQVPEWLNVKEVIEDNGLQAGTTKNDINALSCIYRYVNGSSKITTVEKKKEHMKKAIHILKETVGVSEITHISLQAICILIREFVDTGYTTEEKLIERFKDIEMSNFLSMAITLKNGHLQKNIVTSLAYVLGKEYNRVSPKKEQIPIEKLPDTKRLKV